MNNSEGKSLYERMGGASAIQTAVDIFYNKIITDERINRWFAHMDMQLQRKKQEIFLTTAFGGPNNYSLRDMATAHQKLVEKGLCDADFDAVAENLRDTLMELSTPLSLIEEAMALLESQRDIVLCRQHQKHPNDPSLSPIDEELEKEGYGQFAVIRKKKEEGCDEKYFRLVLEIPENSNFTFQPGNHLHLMAQIGEKWIKRAYTPVNEPGTKEVELLIKLYSDGPMSQHLFQLPLNSKVWVKGPNGHYVYRHGCAKRINMFACGTGITPIWQVLKEIAKHETETSLGDCKTDVVFVHGSRNETELILHQELTDLLSRHRNLRAVRTLSSPSDQWKGMKGRISEVTFPLFGAHPPEANTINMICGTDDFVVHMKRILKNEGHFDHNVVIF